MQDAGDNETGEDTSKEIGSPTRRIPALIDRTEPIKDTIFAIYRLAGPIISSILVTSLMGLLSLGFAGRYLGSDYLGYVTVSNTLYTVTGFYTGYGMCCALDMLSTQEFGRDQESPELGNHLIKAWAVTSVWGGIFTLFWVFSKPLLPFLLAPDAVEPCYQFLRLTPLMYFPAVWSQAMAKFLQAQHRTRPITIAALAALATSAPLHQLFVPTFGVSGLVMAQGSAFTVQFFVLFHYVKKECSGTTWRGYNEESLDDIVPFAWTAVNAMWATLVEGASFEMTVLTPVIVGLPTNHISANSLMLSMLFVTFSVQFGISAAASVLVGNAVGSQALIRARFQVVVVMVTAALQGFLNATAIMVVHPIFFRLFTDDEAVIKIASNHLYAVALSHQADILQYTFQGVCRGFGLFKTATFVTIVGQWCIAVPLGLFFAGRGGEGIAGAFQGFLIGACLECMAFIVRLNPYLDNLTDHHKIKVVKPVVEGEQAETAS